MNPLHTNHRTRTRRAKLLSTAAAVVGAALLTVAPGTADRAEAFTYVDTGGYAGSVAPRQIEGRALFVGSSSYPRPGLRVPSVTVGRSVATSGAQRVGITYQTELWNGSRWVNHWSTFQAINIPAGVNAVNSFPYDFTDLGTGYYRVSMAFVWTDAYGRTIGSRWVGMYHTGDNRCVASNYIGCSLGQGFIYLRR